MPRHFKIDDLLEAGDKADYELFLRAGNPTIDAGVAWLAERGYKLSRKAVWTHKSNFDDVIKGVKQSAEMARAFAALARDGGSDLSEAALGRFQQLMMEKLFSLSSEDGIDSGELMKLSIALKGAVATKQQIEEIKAEFAERQKTAIEEASKAAQSGASGAAVVDTIKRAMGITTTPGGAQ